VTRLEGLSLLDWAGAEGIALPQVPPPQTQRLEGMIYSIYQLRSLGVSAEGEGEARPLLAVIQARNDTHADAIAGSLTGNGRFAGSWSILNPFHRVTEPHRVVCVLATGDSPLSHREMVDLEKAANGALRFFVIYPTGAGR